MNHFRYVFNVNSLQNGEIIGQYINLIVTSFSAPFDVLPCLVISFWVISILAYQISQCKL